MHTADPPPTDDLRLTLQLELRLHRSGPSSAWSAELHGEPSVAPLVFPTLPALIGYIARLDRPAGTGGLR